MNLNDIRISKYSNTFSMYNTEVSILEELERIKKGSYKELISRCREYVNSGNIAAYKIVKKELPAVTFSGSFNGPHKKDHLKQYNNLIVIDIDNIELDITAVKQRLMDDPYIISAWCSPSGKGLKALIHISSAYDKHKQAFDQLLMYFKNTYDLDIDKTGSDLCRLCYVSYDQDIKINSSFEKFIIPDQSKSEISKIEGKKSISLFEGVRNQKLNSSYNRRLVERVIKYLKTRNLSITKEYNNWYRVALSIANSFNPDIGQKYFLQLSSLDENYDEYKCIELLDYCYRHKRDAAISFRTIVHLAKTNGFKE